MSITIIVAQKEATTIEAVQELPTTIDIAIAPVQLNLDIDETSSVDVISYEEKVNYGG